MKISLKSEKVHQGGIFSGIFIIKDYSNLSYDYITCSVGCNVYTPGSKLTIMTSVHKMLNFKNGISTIMFIIPIEAPPSLTEEKYQIIHQIYLYIYHGLEKQILKFPFTVNCSYVFNKSIIYKIMIEDDMFLFDLSKDTRFQAIINKMRIYDTATNMRESLLNIVKSKVEAFKQLDLSNEITKNSHNGDIWFYYDNDMLNLDNNDISANVQYDDEIYATISYRKYIKDLLYLIIFCHKKFKELSVFLIKRINEELDDTYLLDRIDFTNCIYKALKISIPTNLSFSFKSNIFEIEYHLQIYFDDVSCILPIILIDYQSNIDVS